MSLTAAGEPRGCLVRGESVVYMWNLLKRCKRTYLQNRSRVAEVGKAHSWQRRKAGGGRWAGAWDEHTHTHYVKNRKPIRACHTAREHHSTITQTGKEFQKEQKLSCYCGSKKDKSRQANKKPGTQYPQQRSCQRVNKCGV